MFWYKKYLFIVLVLLFLMAVMYAYKEYNRRPADLSTVKPDVIVTAVDLVNAFETDEGKANVKFNGKTLLVKGVVAEINNQQDTLLNIYLGKNEAMHKVSCAVNIRNKEMKHTPVVGDIIAVKGICTGFLQDVEMNRCVIEIDK